MLNAKSQGGLKEIIQLGSAFVHDLTVSLLDNCPDSVVALAGSLEHLESLVRWDRVFPRVTMEDAVRQIEHSDSSYVRKHTDGFKILTRRGEEALVALVGSGIGVWVTHFPASSIPFYQALDPQSEGRGLNADLLLGGCEVLGCGQRHLTAPQVLRALLAQEISSDPYRWYAELRQLFPLQTAGFGLGLERFLMWALKQADIRDCTLFFRDSRISCFP